MKTNTESELREKRVKSRREAILWDGGIYFGGVMASLMFGFDLIRHAEHYMPSRSPASLVLFSWGWMLLVNPLIWFGAGCLFGFVMWSLKESGKK
jgi:hypothetical protein